MGIEWALGGHDLVLVLSMSSRPEACVATAYVQPYLPEPSLHSTAGCLIRRDAPRHTHTFVRGPSVRDDVGDGLSASGPVYAGIDVKKISGNVS